MPDVYAIPSVGPRRCHTLQVRVIAKREDNLI